ncbi:MAG: transposase family protein [Methanobrevibacter sp.]|nr:transposase family protein [Methanobrevibacter sp.]
MQALIVNKVKETENNIIFFCSTKPSPQVCPHCRETTSKIHGYRIQIFKDLSIREKFVSISLKNVGISAPAAKPSLKTIPSYLNTTAPQVVFLPPLLINYTPTVP